MRVPTECDGCQNRTDTYHATCEIHREAWEARRERNNKALKSREATWYTVDMVHKTKSGKTRNQFNKYRPDRKR